MISRFFFKKMLSQQFIVKVFSILFEIENIEKKQEKKLKINSLTAHEPDVNMMMIIYQGLILKHTAIGDCE